MAIPSEVGAAFVPDLGSGQLWFGFVMALALVVVVGTLWRIVTNEMATRNWMRERQHEEWMEQQRREIKAEVMAALQGEAGEDDATG